ncbi:putative sulfate/molybdate transporter [Pigmentiphaga sp.]|jgi:Sulfate permease and related transporters (MFS superfamily)|uniref:putative sulfate/molybdate transporter n=1 Tax=Pigmentiphaga sp. TaxID=1977564 RepID=UPI0025CF9826|nr:putative sulfate/molybdate transporter [Pigmentiphaga sp.]MBX6318227.1 putative sulfate/molybdate transporter [Pigmentiphaga sp.]
MHEPSSRSVPDAATGNRYDRMEWAGAFGDLGTLIPFVAAYIGVLKLDPFGVLFGFGLCMLACGLYYKTPIPVQPMKAIGAVAVTQAAQTALVTPGAVYAAALATGAIWLFLGLSGAATRLSRAVPPAVVLGITLGLGFGFMLEGVKMMHNDWPIAAIAGLGTLLLMANRTFPAMFVLLAFGAAVGLWRQPHLLHELAQAPVGLPSPRFALSELGWNELMVGVALLALPQVPLTLGNAVIAIKDENNRLFPHRPVTENGLATSTGIMNLVSSTAGGVPMCHGAGGMAGHVAFGARTGGAVVILGVILLALALFFSSGVALLFQVFPLAILGVILFLTGAQLALGSSVLPADKNERYITLATAALCMWNVAAGFVAGLLLHWMAKRRWIRM